MSTQLDALLGRIPDANLRSQIAAQIVDLQSQRTFGLVFEEHLPETVRLPGQKVRRGVTVEPRSEGAQAASGLVTRVKDGVATVRTKDDVDVFAPAANLVVVRDFGEPIYPGLTPLGRLERGGDKPDHIVIEGENFHALETLQYTHAGAVDCIYIDPPYNTGGDLIYNDTYVGREDTYRHSKWLSFMERRLRLARELLKPTGVIIVAIDDNEQAHLKVLMDQVFGPGNFLANVVWQGGGKNDARFTAGGLDYMLTYAKDQPTLLASGARWIVPKHGIDLMLETVQRIWSETGGDSIKATKALRAWQRLNTAAIEKNLLRYQEIDERGRVFFRGDLTKPTPTGRSRYDLFHPVTGVPVPTPANGWRFSPETMAEKIAEGRILFGKDHTSQPYFKRYLDEVETKNIAASFVQDRRVASKALIDILGEPRFAFPKDTSVLAEWIGSMTCQDPDAVVLDFFAGSGSTAQAVMELNARDGGRRQCILVTNNEVNEKTASILRRRALSPGEPDWEAQGIFERVTRPRIETVVTGLRPDGSRYSDGLDENVTFLSLDYLDRDEVQRGIRFEQVAHLLWLKAGGRGPAITGRVGAWSLPVGGCYGVLFDVGAWREFSEAVAAADRVTMAYVITDSAAAFAQVKSSIATGVRPVHLYENYLTNFEINTGAKR